jgi:hypothetical protein
MCVTTATVNSNRGEWQSTPAISVMSIANIDDGDFGHDDREC